ncbi:YqjF family protein [Pedobacter nutrimenti]|uniref:DUF2071 domain-containing protein n=1 Tax=Pedobacter nutrimenti TaxID=1241337 RepID=A0A318UE54_9SPHI|nr:DUF2071 domain-containing protein [Pedobacter nutrimenti]PYF72427.1 hypothetical protein B0O44_10676 [Pedobacter nutrimenti]
MSFLTAEWKKLAIANYAIDPAILTKHLPAGTTLDFWEGHCYVSLIGFLFKDTRLKGVRVPFHSNFEEVNLRFYVRYPNGENWKRGVVFIKEIVPKYALAFIANTFYKEHYQHMPMKHSWEESPEELKISYQWKNQQQWQSFSLQAALPALNIEPGSRTEFITEHYWGYSLFHPQKTIEYEVKHPKWTHYLIKNYQIEVDFELNYGKDFAFLNQKTPDSVMLAEGSRVSVENKKILLFEH